MGDEITSEISELRRRVSVLEAESGVRRVLARYMEICDCLGPSTSMDELGALFCADAVWEGRGGKYADTFGGHRGREAIVRFLNSYREPMPHFSSNAHFLTSEQVRADGDRASGTWVMLQTPTFSDGSAFLLAARLHVDFRREDEGWRIYRFATTNLFSRPVERGWNAAIPLPVPQTND